jgi:CheY-like chemotaxis protein
MEQHTSRPALVLIVDDVPDNLQLLHDALDAAGHTVLVATHGEAALQRARLSLPDVILLDAVMPGMDGFEVARRLKQDYVTRPIPIVFMTGLTDSEHVVAAFAAGGADYVTKPLRPPEVLARIAAHTANARQMQQASSALDAFGQATLALNPDNGRLVWQTSPGSAVALGCAGAAGQAARGGFAGAMAGRSRAEAAGQLPSDPRRAGMAGGAARRRAASHAGGADCGLPVDPARSRSAALAEPGQNQPRHRRHPGHEPAYGQ